MFYSGRLASEFYPVLHADSSQLFDLIQIRNSPVSIKPLGYCNVTSFEPE
jgi:hypothetical protein